MYLPMGSLANRHGRIVGDNLAGLNRKIEGVLGSWCVKLFDQNAAGTGLTLAGAKRAGFDAIAVQVCQQDRAHFYPDKDFMFLELIAERGTRRVLGVQGVSLMGDALVARINAVAAVLGQAPSVDVLSNLELPYSPPFTTAMDILNMLGNVADNVLAGRNRSITPEQFAELFARRDDDATFFIDCRDWGNAGPFVEKYPGRWHNIPQGQLAHRLNEVPRDKHLVLVCNTGTRSYEAYAILARAGYTDMANVAGGMVALHAAGVDI
jgi:rhodanese-related sulfurtransferase